MKVFYSIGQSNFDNIPVVATKEKTWGDRKAEESFISYVSPLCGIKGDCDFLSVKRHTPETQRQLGACKQQYYSPPPLHVTVKESFTFKCTKNVKYFFIL